MKKLSFLAFFAALALPAVAPAQQGVGLSLLSSSGTAGGWDCSAFMRYHFRVFAIALGLALSSVARTQELPSSIGSFVDVDEEPHEAVPLESLIHYPKEAKKKGIEGDII